MVSFKNYYRNENSLTFVQFLPFGVCKSYEKTMYRYIKAGEVG